MARQPVSPYLLTQPRSLAEACAVRGALSEAKPCEACLLSSMCVRQCEAVLAGLRCQGLLRAGDAARKVH
jgi:hypothetical protein